MSEWKEHRLGDIAEIIMGQSPKGETCNETGTGFPLLNGPTEFTAFYPIPTQYTTDPKRFSETNDLLFCVRGSTTGKMNWSDQKYAIGRGIGAIRHRKGAVLNPFIKGLIEYHLPNLLQSATGSTFPNVSREQLNGLKIIVPGIRTQTAIAEILSSLDDKIELNNKINQELENLAQTLFKHWFIDFEFPNENGEPYKSSGGEMEESELGEIPKGWKVKQIENLTVNMNSGGTPSTRRSDYYEGNINWYSTKELKDRFLFESERMISNIGLENSSAKIFPPNTVVMAIYAAPTVGRLGVLSEEAAFNQAALGFVAKKEIGYEYLFLLLKHLRNELNNLANGAAQQNLNVGIVKNYKINYPTNDLFNSFMPIISPLFKSIKNNQIENSELKKTRDYLLPKLISGELEINEITN